MENQSNGMKYYTCGSCGASVASAETHPRCPKCGASVFQGNSKVNSGSNDHAVPQRTSFDAIEKVSTHLNNIEASLDSIQRWVTFFGIMSLIGMLGGVILTITSCGIFK